MKLFKARDEHKDQTYFLSHVHQNALQKVLFPVGDLLKSEVKQIATKYGLVEIAGKREVGQFLRWRVRWYVRWYVKWYVRWYVRRAGSF